MRKTEYQSSPIVALTATTSSSPDFKVDGINRFLPATAFSATFFDQELPRQLRIKLPIFANADLVALQMRVSLARSAEEIRASIQETAASSLPEESRVAALSLNLRNFFYIRRGLLEDYKRTVESATQSLFSNKPRAITTPLRTNLPAPLIQVLQWWAGWRARRRADNLARQVSTWSGEIDAALKALTDWQANGGMTATTLADLSACADALAKALNDLREVRFVMPARLSAAGTIDLSPLTKLSSELTVLCEGIVTPFTTDKEPNTQGKRSGLILALLALTLLGLSQASPAWIADLPGMASTRDFFHAPLIADVRESLVALLLIFPAALYAQFFQSRPKSPAGHRAQQASFALFSLTFVLPTIPAAVLAGGGSFETATNTLLITGLLALGSAITAWTAFSQRALLGLRRRAIWNARPPKAFPSAQEAA